MNLRKIVGASLIVSPVVAIFIDDAFIYGLWVTVCTYELLLLAALVIYKGYILIRGE